jgi:hypothetical protein
MLFFDAPWIEVCRGRGFGRFLGPQCLHMGIWAAVSLAMAGPREAVLVISVSAKGGQAPADVLTLPVLSSPTDGR